MALAKTQILSRREDFLQLRRNGDFVRGRFLVLNYQRDCLGVDGCEKNQERTSQVAVISPKKIGIAVKRNRLRRQLRAIIAMDFARLPVGKFIVILRYTSADVSFAELQKCWRYLLRQINSEKNAIPTKSS